MKDRADYVDWPRLLGDLQYLLGEPDYPGAPTRTPVGTHALANYLGIPRTTIVRWIEGARLEYHQGCKLIDVWVTLTGKSREFVPITIATYSAAQVR